jgi:hypothetical protein
MAYFKRTTKPKNIYNLTEGEPLSAGRKKNECRNERCPVGAESESLGRAELRSSHDLPQCLIETEDLVGEEEDAVRDGQDAEDYHQAEIEEWNRRQKMEEENLMESEVGGY